MGESLLSHELMRKLLQAPGCLPKSPGLSRGAVELLPHPANAVELSHGQGDWETRGRGESPRPPLPVSLILHEHRKVIQQHCPTPSPYRFTT
jgi:hypothetical protein